MFSNVWRVPYAHVQPSVEGTWAQWGACEVADVLGGVPDERRLEVAWDVVDDGEQRHSRDTCRMQTALPYSMKDA